MQVELLHLIMLLLTLATFIAVLMILGMVIKVVQALNQKNPDGSYQWMVPKEMLETLTKVADTMTVAAERQEQTGNLLVTLTNEVLSFQQDRLEKKKD